MEYYNLYKNLGVRNLGPNIYGDIVHMQHDSTMGDSMEEKCKTVKKYYRTYSLMKNVFFAVEKQHEPFKQKWNKLRLVTLDGIQDEYFSKLAGKDKYHLIYKITTEYVQIMTQINLKLPYKYKAKDSCSYLKKQAGYFIYSIPKKCARFVNLVSIFISKKEPSIESRDKYYKSFHVILADGDDMYVSLAKHDTSKNRVLVGVFNDYETAAKGCVDFLANLESSGLLAPLSLFIEELECGAMFTQLGDYLKSDIED